MNRREALITVIAGATGGLVEKFFGRKIRRTFYSVKSGDFGIVRDANGKQIPLTIECDTESGWVRQFVPNEDGKPQLDPMNTRQLWVRTGLYPCPLTFEEHPERGTRDA